MQLIISNAKYQHTITYLSDPQLKKNAMAQDEYNNKTLIHNWNNKIFNYYDETTQLKQHQQLFYELLFQKFLVVTVLYIIW